MMASTITWIYADRLKADPKRRHKVKGEPVLPFRMFGGLSLKPRSMMILIGFAQNRQTHEKILWWLYCYAW